MFGLDSLVRMKMMYWSRTANAAKVCQKQMAGNRQEVPIPNGVWATVTDNTLTLTRLPFGQFTKVNNMSISGISDKDCVSVGFWA